MEQFEPLPWQDYFDETNIIKTTDEDRFNVYIKRSLRESQHRILVFCVHGAGFSGLSFALLAKELCINSEFSLDLAAIDLRGHGLTQTSDDARLDIQTLVNDCNHVLSALIDNVAVIVLVGHSLGGSVVVGMGKSCKDSVKKLVQLTVVIDVVRHVHVKKI
ncbi:hypothetical protein ACOME3_004235 [Neoechinorhynchus agilis]